MSHLAGWQQRLSILPGSSCSSEVCPSNHTQQQVSRARRAAVVTNAQQASLRSEAQSGRQQQHQDVLLPLQQQQYSEHWGHQQERTARVVQQCRQQSSASAQPLVSTAAFYAPSGGCCSGVAHSSSSPTITQLPGVSSEELPLVSHSPQPGLSSSRPQAGGHVGGIVQEGGSNSGQASSSSSSNRTTASEQQQHAAAAAVRRSGVSHHSQHLQANLCRKPKQKVSRTAGGSLSNHAGSPAGGKRSGKQTRHSRAPSQHSSTSSSIADEQLSASKRLTSSIAHASCWQQLHELLQQHSSSMNHIHAAALLNRTSRLVQYHQLCQEQQQQFMGFYTAALQLAYSTAQGAARPRELSSMLWAVARVGLHPGTEWLAAYLAALQPQLTAMNAQDSGLLVWALARFRYVPETGFWTALLAATQQQFAATASSSDTAGARGHTQGVAVSTSRHSPQSCKHRSSSRGFDAQGLSNVLWGLAVLDLNPGQVWLAAAVTAAGSLLQRGLFGPQALAVMLWALAQFGCRPQQAWLHAAAEVAAGQLYGFKPAELSMLCHALARLHYQPHAALKEQQQQQVRQGKQQLQQQQQPWQQQQQQDISASLAAPDQATLMSQLQAVSWPQLQCLRFTEAASLVWALGVLGQQPHSAWLDAALQQLQATLHEADAKALASACYGLARMQHTAEDWWWEAVWQQVPFLLGAPAAEAAAVPAGGAADHFAGSNSAAAADSGGGSSSFAALCAHSQSLATFLWALGKLDAPPPPAATASCLLQASEQLLRAGAVNGAEVTASTAAAAKLKLQPPSSWLGAVDVMFAALLQHSCSAGQTTPSPAATPAVAGIVAPQGGSDGLHSPQQHHTPQQQTLVMQQQQQQQDEQQEQQEAALSLVQQALQELLTQQQQVGTHGHHVFSQQHNQQQQQHSSQHLSVAATAAVQTHPVLNPKEVCNTVFSLARLHHTPSQTLLSALQQYVQLHGSQLVAADQQQLRRALQSWRDQQHHRDKTAAAAAASAVEEAVAASESEAPGVDDCACSSRGAGRVSHQGSAHCGPPSDQLLQGMPCGLEDAPTTMSSSSSSSFARSSFRGLGFLQEGAGPSAVSAVLDDDDMPVYGHYHLTLPVKHPNSSSSSAARGVVCGECSEQQLRVDECVSAAPSRRRKALESLRNQVVAAGRLSVAAG